MRINGSPSAIFRLKLYYPLMTLLRHPVLCELSVHPVLFFVSNCGISYDITASTRFMWMIGSPSVVFRFNFMKLLRRPILCEFSIPRSAAWRLQL